MNIRFPKGASLRNYWVYYFYFKKLEKYRPLLFVSYPKSGNTWWRFIYSNIINSLENLQKNVISFHDIEDIIPRENKKIIDFPYSILPPAIKTHRLYKRYYNHTRSIYIYRNPLDVIVSQFHHFIKWEGAVDSSTDVNSIKDATTRNEQAKKIREKGIKLFLRDKLPHWVNHYKTWIEMADAVCSYEDMKKDTFVTVRKCLREVELDISDQIILNAISNSEFSRVKKIEEEYGRPMPEGISFEKLKYRFVRDGTVNQWDKYFDDEDVGYLKTYCKNNGLDVSIFNFCSLIK